MPVVASRLVVKFYLWFLVALTITVVATAGVVWLLASRNSETGPQNWVLDEVRTARDLAAQGLEAH